jgi:hypothetical protein
MSTRWFYSHDGEAHGPLTTEEVKALATQGKIGRSDLVWREGSGPEEGLPAEAVLDMTESPVVELPDWLEDVRKHQRFGPFPPLEPIHDLPEWIDDLRLWIALDYSGEKIPWDYTLGRPPLEEGICGAVEQWFPEEQPPPAPPNEPSDPVPCGSPSLKTDGTAPVEIQNPIPTPEPVKPVLPSPSQKPPISEVVPLQQKSSIPVGRLQPESLPSKTTKPPMLAEPSKTGAETLPPASQSPPPPQCPPIETQPKAEFAAPEIKTILPVSKKTRTSPARASSPDLLAEQALEMTGFDPRTGQVVDVARFQAWKQEQARVLKGKTKISNAGLMRIFRKARTEVEQWLDQPRSRPLILALDLEAIRNHPEIQKVLENYAGYGDAFRAKLLRHLEFMAENRCKYYTARPEG